MGAIQGAMSQTWAGKFRSDFVKSQDEAKKAGANRYKEYRTTGFGGITDEDKLKAYEKPAKEKKMHDRYKAATGFDYKNKKYDPQLDTGDDVEQLKAREYLKNASTAGEAIYEDETNQLKIDETRNKREGGYLEILNTLAKANMKVGSLRGDLNNMDVNTSAWNMADAAAVKKALYTEIQARSKAGKNTDMLQETANQIVDAIESASSAKKAAEDRKLSDSGFARYIGEGTGKDAYIHANAGTNKELEKVAKLVRDNAKETRKIEERTLELEKNKAEANQRDLFGKLSKDEEEKKKDYDDARKKD